MKRTTQTRIELSEQELKEAIVFWLSKAKNMPNISTDQVRIHLVSIFRIKFLIFLTVIAIATKKGIDP